MNVYPAFYCVGCILPLHVTPQDIGHGDARVAEPQALTLLVNRPQTAGDEFDVRQFQAAGVTARYVWASPNQLRFTVTAQPSQPVIIVLEDVALNGACVCVCDALCCGVRSHCVC